MSKLISRNNIIKYKNPSQKIEQDIHLTDDDLMLMGWQRLYYDNDPNHWQVKGDDPLRKTLDESDWWVGDLLGNLVPKEAVLHYWNTKNAPASNITLEKRWEDEADRLNLLEIEKELQRRKNKLFNKDVDTVFVKAPLALLGLGIGGATALPYLAPGTIGGNIIGATAFGEALNTAIKYGTGKTMGEHAVEAAHALGIPQSLWGDFGIQMLGDMPLYVGGDLIGKAVTNTGQTLGKEALNQIALNKSYFPTTKDLGKAMNKQVKNSTSKTFELFPGTIGWAPKQIITGVHTSDNPNLKFNYNFLNWAEREHGAPKGIYFTANQKIPSGGFLNDRQYAYQVKSTFDKPIVQVGDIKTNTKNNIRNQIERAAMDLGADGIIYQDIADNNLKHQTIVKSLNPDQLVEITGVIDRLNPKVTRVVDSNGTIRFRLDSHTPEMPREFVLDPQGDNKFYVHMRTWNGEKIPANMTDAEKNKLFESVYEELPEGAEILFPESSESYPATRGTVAGLIRLSRDPRFLRGNTTGTLIYTDKNGDLQTFIGNSFIKSQKPLDSHLLGEDAVKMDTRYLKDSFGKEITPTPFPGTDKELSQMAYDSQIDVLKDYFTNPQKIEQVKSEMHWGDKEYNEFLDELMRILGIQADVNIRDLQSGFTDIGSSSGKVIGEGANAEARQKLSLNKDRIANMELALETAIHEIGGHGKTLSIRLNPNDVVSTKFGKWFPRMKLFTRKNKTIADTTLELNEKGKLFSNFNSENALKHYLKWSNYSPSEINDLLEQYRHFKYITDEQELYARGYTSLLMLSLKPNYKTLNLELLEKYYTPESVKKYINSVLSISIPIIGSYGLIQSNRKGGKLIQEIKLWQ